MYTSQKTLYRIEEDVTKLSLSYPELYEHIKHVTSLTRQMQVPYMYLADLITDNSKEPKPKFIRPSVLNVLINEVKQLKERPYFNAFLKLIQNNRYKDAPEIFLLILGAKPEALANNAIIK